MLDGSDRTFKSTGHLSGLRVIRIALQMHECKPSHRPLLTSRNFHKDQNAHVLHAVSVFDVGQIASLFTRLGRVVQPSAVMQLQLHTPLHTGCVRWSTNEDIANVHLRTQDAAMHRIT